MKSILMIVALLFLLTACTPVPVATETPAAWTASPAASLLPTPDPSPTPVPVKTVSSPIAGLTHPVPFISDMRLFSHTDLFTEADLAIGPVAMGDTQDDVIAALGEPDQIADLPGHAIQYSYPGLELTFIPKEDIYIVQDMVLTAGELKTPRDIGIGSYVKETLYVYVDQIELATDNLAIFYRCNTGSPNLIAIPPSAIMWKGEDTLEWIIQLSIPVDPNPYVGYTPQEIEEHYRDLSYYSLRFTTNYGRVTRIHMTMGPYTQ